MLSQVGGAEIDAQPIPEYNKLFQRAQGWIGADADYTVKLPKDRVLWLFGDTLLGEVCSGRRLHATLINNSLGVQRGLNPASATMRFLMAAHRKVNPQHRS